MPTIVAIGGGELKDLETLPIDRAIVKLVHKKYPKVLFIPTASNDSVRYWETFQNVYGKKLRCETDVLYLIKEKLSKKEIAFKILSADIIYVGGGNTLRMFRLWRKYGVDTLYRPMRVSALGIIPLTMSPHHIREKSVRDSGIAEIMKRTPGMALALDDNSAILIQNDRYEVLTSKPNVGISKVFQQQGKVKWRPVKASGLLVDLLKKME